MNENTENNIGIENLSEEQIKKLTEDIAKSFKDVDVNNPEELMEYLQKNYAPDIPDLDRPKKMISCPHEIVFTVRALVLEENEKGETMGCKEVCQKNYHIPVPSTKDYNAYMECFFKYLENCITSSAKRATEDTENKNG